MLPLGFHVIAIIIIIRFNFLDSLKELTTREKGFKRRNVKLANMRSLHLEAKCFIGKRRLNLSLADVLPHTSVDSTTTTGARSNDV